MSALPAMLRKARPWAIRAGAVLLLLAVYVGGWRPARLWLMRHAARPLLASVATPRAGQFGMRTGVGGRVLRVVPVASAESTGDAPSTAFQAPAGIRFLLPALFLVAAFPKRPYWAWLWLLHVGAGAAALAVLALGLGWGGGGLALCRFWNRFALDIFSLVVPLMMWLHGRQGRFLPEGE